MYVGISGSWQRSPFDEVVRSGILKLLIQNVEIDPCYPAEKYICPYKDEKTLEEPWGSPRLAVGYFDTRYVWVDFTAFQKILKRPDIWKIRGGTVMKIVIIGIWENGPEIIWCFIHHGKMENQPDHLKFIGEEPMLQLVIKAIL